MLAPCSIRRIGRGFTLVEILIAIGIFVLGMTGVLSMFAYAWRSHRLAMDNVETALLAQELITAYAAILDDSKGPTGALLPASEFDTVHVPECLTIKGGDGNVDPRFSDDGFVLSANYPRFWYSVVLRDWPEPESGAAPVSNAVRMVIKITGPPWAQNAGDQAQLFETVLLRKPRVVQP